MNLWEQVRLYFRTMFTSQILLLLEILLHPLVLLFLLIMISGSQSENISCEPQPQT